MDMTDKADKLKLPTCEHLGINNISNTATKFRYF